MEKIKQGGGGSKEAGLILSSVVRTGLLEKVTPELPACQGQGL